MTTGADPRLAGGRLTIDLDALVANWQLLAEKSLPAQTSAVVKADAYGLGIIHVVPALWQAGCRTFFVALAEEGLRVRAVAPDARVFVLNGFFSEALPVYEESDLIPVLGSLQELDLWRSLNAKRKDKLPFALHVDTGMNRLGVTLDEALAFAADRRNDKPILLMTHLATADDRAHALNDRQIQSFHKLRAAFSGIESSIANSPGIFHSGVGEYELSRPGVAMYGGEPFSGGANPMRHVVTLEARIVQIRTGRKGETVGYGATARLGRDTRIAVCSVGYADGYLRSASGSGVPLRGTVLNGGEGFVAGSKVPVLGRITMDLTSFDITDLPVDAVRPGDYIELFGQNVPLDDAARAAGTIGYELLTSLGTRYHRRYLKSESN
ncbi:alanine racemase [Phyllobacterium endophyticum]|uniref:Alanine racemase n=1 Tax=Phyllobacterium endophyticum TaxID=1149773 RepID=A0A2P7AWM9_9HYPH|nr:alanine racemase [Phyllobacterium endophyticum]MBB3235241.1 alanine racemase [Phyllobacterium endophyticum]PSH58612.1 alanine racemase [Phyllobacterium endophyticum]TYR39297.1 alanine racemase [Phyllobacterium endophyticum]